MSLTEFIEINQNSELSRLKNNVIIMAKKIIEYKQHTNVELVASATVSSKCCVVAPLIHLL